MATRVIFDTDPGIDDAMALFFLLRSPELQLDAVTTVFGNVDLDQTTRNALSLLDVAKRPDLPVARGAAGPILREHRRDGGGVVHGDNGLGGVDVPVPSRQPGPRRAAEEIIERVMAAPGEITLIAVGPLTNIALAARLEPGIVEAVREVIVMGGVVTLPGNATPLAEANFACDAEAAWIVFHAGFPLTMVGLDVTMKALMHLDHVETLRERAGRVGETIAAISRHYGDHYARRTGRPGFPMHDSAAVAYAVDRSLFRTQRVYVDIGTGSGRAAGMSMADWRGQWGCEPNVDVCLDVDADRFVSLYMERLTAQRPG
ncbi:MAG: nucleoside hydrolase [Chloroflexi bacterium]|nr:nucleoside hydrolase [Chloroflexota bacterium]